jgi:hypothetical protein
MTSITEIETDIPTLHAFRVEGKIAAADVEGMAERLQAAFEAHDEIDILIVMSSYQGIEAGAVFDRKALSAQARSVRHVRRYGVVGAPDWAEAMINFFAPVSPIEAKTFDLEDEQSAWQWIKGR